MIIMVDGFLPFIRAPPYIQEKEKFWNQLRGIGDDLNDAWLVRVILMKS